MQATNQKFKSVICGVKCDSYNKKGELNRVEHGNWATSRELRVFFLSEIHISTHIIFATALTVYSQHYVQH